MQSFQKRRFASRAQRHCDLHAVLIHSVGRAILLDESANRREPATNGLWSG
jgi:hypothetical protein